MELPKFLRKTERKNTFPGLKNLRAAKKTAGFFGKMPEVMDKYFTHSNSQNHAVMVEGAPRQLFEGYLINLDSSVREDDFILPDLESLLQTLASVRRQAYFVTNDCYLHPQEFVDRLAKHNLEIPIANVFAPVRIAELYLKHEFNGAKILSLADQQFNTALKTAGVNLVDAPHSADVVLVSHNLDFNFDLFTKGYQALTANPNAKLVTLSMMRTRKMGADGGVVPGTRGLVRALESAARTSYYENLGRPGTKFLEIIFAESALDPAETLFVSDSLSNDIRPVKRFGVPTALLLTGSSSLAEAKSVKRKTSQIILLTRLLNLYPPIFSIRWNIRQKMQKKNGHCENKLCR
ncbi:HAD hydrolase-like protein [Arcanobacterium hippocoleae]